MATTPVVTNTLPPEYEPYRQAINAIVYSKQQWQQGQQSGNTGLQTWAQNNAQQYYSQLPAEVANQLRGMDYSAAQQWLDGLRATGSQTAVTTPQQTQTLQPNVNPISLADLQNQAPTYTPPTNPYDQQVADLIRQLQQATTAPRNNPMDAQVAQLIAELQQRINNPTVIDPRTTAEYEAGKAAIERQTQENIRVAQEALGASGFARSTNLAERAQTIADEATEYLETQLVPQIAQQLYLKDQQGLANSMSMLQMMMQQQGLFDERQQRELQNLYGLLDALTGQQSTFDSRQQNSFQNQLALQQQALQERMFQLEQQKVQFDQQYTALQVERQKLADAIARTELLGSVSQADAAVLGVPEGTPSLAAREAVAQREQELLMQQRQIEAQRSNLELQIRAERDNLNARLAAERQNLERSLAAERENLLTRLRADQQTASINQLLALWEATGRAPDGLQQFGVQPGQQYNPYLTPSQQLDQIQLNQMLEELQAQERLRQILPEIQSRYSLDSITAEAVANALDNPTLESALADIKAHELQLRQMGVDTKKLRQAVEQEFNRLGRTSSYGSSSSNKSSSSSSGGVNWLPGYGVR